MVQYSNNSLKEINYKIRVLKDNHRAKGRNNNNKNKGSLCKQKSMKMIRMLVH